MIYKFKLKTGKVYITINVYRADKAPCNNLPIKYDFIEILHFEIILYT